MKYIEYLIKIIHNVVNQIKNNKIICYVYEILFFNKKTIAEAKNTNAKIQKNMHTESINITESIKDLMNTLKLIFEFLVKILVHMGWSLTPYIFTNLVNSYTILWCFKHLFWVAPFLLCVEILFKLKNIENISMGSLWNFIKSIDISSVSVRFFHLFYTYMAFCQNYIFYSNIELYVYLLLLIYILLTISKAKKVEIYLHLFGGLFLFISNDLTFNSFF